MPRLRKRAFAQLIMTLRLQLEVTKFYDYSSDSSQVIRDFGSIVDVRALLFL